MEVRLCNAYTECQRAINVGEPIGPDKKSEISGQFTRWTSMLTGEEAAAKTQPARKGFSLFGQKRTE